MTVPFTQIVSEPELKDVLDLMKKELLLSLNCHAIATVQSVNFTDQVLTATMNYAQTFFQKSPDGIYNPVNVPYPVLVDCPFIILGGGGGALTFPIAKGDECLILFNDRDIDNWFAGATSGPVASNRLHSFSDGIALVGLNTFSGSYDPDRTVLQLGTTKVALGDKINIQNNAASLYSILNTFFTSLASAVTVVQVAAAGAVAAADIGNLLE